MESNTAPGAVRAEMWIVGSDGSPGAAHAVEWTLAQAVGRAKSVHVVRAWHLPPIAGAEFGVGPLTDMEPSEALPDLETLAQEAVDAGLEVTSEVRYGGAARVLLDDSAEAALLVVGSRGLGGFRRLLLGSVSQQCATHARGPVVVVPGSADGAPTESAVSRLVVGVDGSPAAREALRWAHAFARGELPVVALGAWYPSGFGADELHIEPERMFQQARRTFDATMDAVETEIGAPGCFERQFVSGRPAVALVDDCDATTLLVVGERGHRGLMHGLLGSVATEVLHHAVCPVAVIPAPDPHEDPE